MMQNAFFLGAFLDVNALTCHVISIMILVLTDYDDLNSINRH